ncbi:MAG: ATP phosphoribosyltransferase [Candidatus Daviesbacteria bacterium]
MTRSNLRLAVQKDGRLTESSLDLLKTAGFSFDRYTHILVSVCNNFPLEIIYVRDDDIPRYVEEGTVDLGIIGRNILYEKKAKVKEILPLEFGHCSLMIGVPKDSKIKKVKDLKNKRIATSYPISTKQFFKENKIPVEIITISGSVEITPVIGVSDAIVDLVATGTSMKLNEIRPIETIFNSEAILISSVEALEDKYKHHLIDLMLTRIKGVLSTGRYKYVMMNLPIKALPEIEALAPGLRSPTIIPLAEKGWVAVHVVIKEEIFWDIVEKMKKVGAQGILVSPIEKLII